MKQSENPEAFFEKYRFTSSMTMPHPEHKDTMHFEGLESEYVQRLQREIAELNKYINMQHDKIEFLTNREFYIYKEGKRKE